MKYCNILCVKILLILEGKIIIDFELQKLERGEKKLQIVEVENYLDFVQQMIEKGELV